MKEKYYVAPNHCNCHPETCCCDDWAIYDSEDDQVFETFFRKEEAEYRIAELKSLDLIPEATNAIKLLKKQIKELERKNEIAVKLVIEVKNKGDSHSGRWCSSLAEDAYLKIMEAK